MDCRDPAPDPRAAVEASYRHFGWTMDDGSGPASDRPLRPPRAFRSKHRYTLEEFGLSKQWIQEELDPLMDYHALER